MGFSREAIAELAKHIRENKNARICVADANNDTYVERFNYECDECDTCLNFENKYKPVELHILTCPKCGNVERKAVLNLMLN